MEEVRHERLLRLERISHTRIKTLDPTRTFVLATMSPLEVHGPHLPLGQDVFEAQALAEHAAIRMLERRPDWSVLLLPPLHLGADLVPMFGSVEIPPTVVEDVAYSYFEPFAKAGFARMGYSSFHGGPRHFLALEQAGERLHRRYGCAAASMFSMLLSRVKEGQVFLDAVKDAPGRRAELKHMIRDQHAGYVETSMGLLLHSDLIEKDWATLPGLAPEAEPGAGENDSFLFTERKGSGPLAAAKHLRSLAALLLKEFKFFRSHSYYGYPGFASPEEGRLLFDHLVSLTAQATDEFIERGMDAGVHSPIWKARHILLNRPLNAIYDRWIA